MQIAAWSLTTKQSKLNLKNQSLKNTTKALLKGPKNVLTRGQKFSQLIICSLKRLKLAKVVHWNLLIIVNKRQKPKLSSWTWSSSQF